MLNTEGKNGEYLFWKRLGFGEMVSSRRVYRLDKGYALRGVKLFYLEKFANEAPKLNSRNFHLADRCEEEKAELKSMTRGCLGNWVSENPAVVCLRFLEEEICAERLRSDFLEDRRRVFGWRGPPSGPRLESSRRRERPTHFDRQKMSFLNDRSEFRVEGYWAESETEKSRYPWPMKHEKSWPRQKEFLIKLAEIEKAFVEFEFYDDYCGSSFSRFDKSNLGWREFRGFGIGWPVDFRPHYIEKYNVMPSAEFYDWVWDFDVDGFRKGVSRYFVDRDGFEIQE